MPTEEEKRDWLIGVAERAMEDGRKTWVAHATEISANVVGADKTASHASDDYRVKLSTMVLLTDIAISLRMLAGVVPKGEE